MLSNFFKPWFVYRPFQIVRRLSQSLSQPSPGYQPLPVAWGPSLIADPTRTIGRSIATTGVYDLAVSELMARLIEPGDTVVDAGANVGYMSVLMSMLARDGGRVVSFEPHPDLFPVLQQNVAAIRPAGAAVDARNAALGAETGEAALVIPEAFADNDGIAFVGQAAAGQREVRVPVQTLDEVLGEASIKILKLDVEGFEPAVLKGSGKALAARRIRHIVFEAHDGPRGEVATTLQSFGYEIRQVGWTLRRLVLAAPDAVGIVSKFEAPSCLATLDMADVSARCSPGGWRVLRVLPGCTGK